MINHNAIRNVNDVAFNQPQEGNVIEKLRTLDSQTLSLVAEIDGNIIGNWNIIS